MAKTATYSLIASYTATGSPATYTFSSINQGYTDLRLVVNGGASVFGGMRMRFNGDTATNYSDTYILGSGTAASSGRDVSLTYGSAGYPLNTTTDSVHITDILDYANTTTFKTFLGRSNDPASNVLAQVGLWRKTPEAINTILLYPASGTFVNGSTFKLYGIEAGNA